MMRLNTTLQLVCSRVRCLVFLGLELPYLTRLYQVYRLGTEEFVVVELSRMFGWNE
jgi:hypothetical protein